MHTKYLIGVDLGTSSTKAALYQTDGTLVAEASVEVPLFYPKPSVVEQDSEDFYIGLGSRFAGTKGSENLELPRALYKARFKVDVDLEPGDELAYQIGAMTGRGAERVLRYGFELAKRKKLTRVTAVHKANVLTKIYGLWLEVVSMQRHQRHRPIRRHPARPGGALQYHRQRNPAGQSHHPRFRHYHAHRPADEDTHLLPAVVGQPIPDHSRQPVHQRPCPARLRRSRLGRRAARLAKKLCCLDDRPQPLRYAIPSGWRRAHRKHQFARR